MKIWCETCKGKGRNFSQTHTCYIQKDCKDCNGKGHTELTDADLKELQNIADKWKDAATQEELYLGRCVKAAYAKGYDVNASVVYTSDRFKTLDELIEWGKKQRVE